jgi:hypothetical protein
MNNNEKDTKKEIENSVIFENKRYNETVAMLKGVIAEKDATILNLTEQVGEKDQVIISQGKAHDAEKSARIAAENKVAEQKDLKVEHKGKYFKTEEEKFNDSFLNE